VTDGDRESTPGVSSIRPLETTASLLSRIRAGDGVARDRLLARYDAALRRWTHGRLPAYARDLLDTNDLVQNCLVKALDHMQGFEPRREGAFLAYLRRIILNQIRDEIRRVRRRPGHDPLEEDHIDVAPSPVQIAIGREKLEKYERALASLPEDQQEAIIMSVEMGFTHLQIAEALGSPTANAARMFVARALVRLAGVMNESG